MKTTAPTAAHRPTPIRNRARHEAANRRKEAQEQRRAAAVEKSWSQLKKQGYRQCLYRFSNREYSDHNITPCDGTIEIRAISHETGEIRHYYTYFQENIKFIANTDFLLHDKETTTYLVIRWNSYLENGAYLETARTASRGQKPTEEKILN